MLKQLGTFAILAVCLFAIVIVMGGCKRTKPKDDPPITLPPPPPDVSFVSVSPEDGSQIKADTTITVTFDGAPNRLRVNGTTSRGASGHSITATTEGSTVTISDVSPALDGDLQGKIYLSIGWLNGYGDSLADREGIDLTYVVVPDLTGSYTLDAMKITRPAPGLAGFVLPLVREDEPVTGTLTLTPDNRFSMSVTRPGAGTAKGSGSWKVDEATLTLSTAPGSNFGGKYYYEFDGNEFFLSTGNLVISNAPSGEDGKLWWRKD